MDVIHFRKSVKKKFTKEIVSLGHKDGFYFSLSLNARWLPLPGTSNLQIVHLNVKIVWGVKAMCPSSKGILFRSNAQEIQV